MRLPWVSRELYEAKAAEAERAWTEVHKAVDYANGQTAARREDRTEADARYSALLEKYHDALTPKLPLVTATAVAPERSPSIIAKTIRAEAQGDQRLAGHFWKRVAQIKAEHPDWEDSQVAEELTKWDSTAVETT